MATSTEKLAQLFSASALAQQGRPLVPPRQPGITPDSAKAVSEILEDNHRKTHIFFNEKKFHNHAAHHILAIFAMGADRTLLNAAYQTHAVYQRPLLESPGPIDEKNWKEHIDDERYYQSYLSFFEKQVLEKGVSNAFEQYILSKDANLVPATQSGKAPHMLSRFLGGFLHSHIHAGYGAEFGVLGMWAEAFAQACLDNSNPPDLLPASLFDVKDGELSLVSQLGKLTVSPTKASHTPGPHALSLLGRMVSDPSFAPSAIGIPVPEGVYADMQRIVDVVGDKLKAFLEEWIVEPTKESLEQKITELIWMNVLMYTVPGYAERDGGEDEKKEFRADFFLMHLVTSVLFLPTLVEQLPLQRAVALVRAYFISSLMFYIIRGRPQLPIAEFYRGTTATTTPPGPQPTPSVKLGNATAASVTPQADKIPSAWAPATKIITPNPWHPILQTTLVHPSEHLCKLQRALAHFSACFGLTPPGAFASLNGPGLDGIELLDGTIFVRAAALTANRLRWMREGQDGGSFDLKPFF
ncbi:hypothetical protein K474DRAFT_1707993 [Panus rudis PR-1116 ss-1]|nr:hypothetical protein K474DRAFT_1707993 [Panus rudis PR-1116 ss-1]